MRIGNCDIRKLGAICGIAGPSIYFVVVVVLGFLYEGYSHKTQTMSELGAYAAPHHLVMNVAGLGLLGGTLIIFAFGLNAGVARGAGARLWLILMSISGLALVLTAIFPTDPGGADNTTTGVLHSIFATIAAIAMVAALPSMLFRLHKDDRWRHYSSFTLAVAGLALLISALFGFSLISGWNGVLQRVSMALPFIWVMVMSIRLLRL